MVGAMLASMASSGENARLGLTIALVHLLFNLVGTTMILPVPRIREIPLAGARWLATTAARSRRWAILYVLFLFYFVPAILAFANRLLK